MDYLRLNRILAKPRDLPRLSILDVELRRWIVAGAAICFAVAAGAWLIATRVFAVEVDVPLFWAVLPAMLVLLLFWWTLDELPRFGRWIIVVACAAGFAPCAALFILREDWSGIDCGALAIYFVCIGGLAGRQLRELRLAAS